MRSERNSAMTTGLKCIQHRLDGLDGFRAQKIMGSVDKCTENSACIYGIAQANSQLSACNVASILSSSTRGIGASSQRDAILEVFATEGSSPAWSNCLGKEEIISQTGM